MLIYWGYLNLKSINFIVFQMSFSREEIISVVARRSIVFFDIKATQEMPKAKEVNYKD